MWHCNFGATFIWIIFHIKFLINYLYLYFFSFLQSWNHHATLLCFFRKFLTEVINRNQIIRLSILLVPYLEQNRAARLLCSSFFGCPWVFYFCCCCSLVSHLAFRASEQCCRPRSSCPTSPLFILCHSQVWWMSSH